MERYHRFLIALTAALIAIAPLGSPRLLDRYAVAELSNDSAVDDRAAWVPLEAGCVDRSPLPDVRPCAVLLAPVPPAGADAHPCPAPPSAPTRAPPSS